jgi:hypothetical protein
MKDARAHYYLNRSFAKDIDDKDLKNNVNTAPKITVMTWVICAYSDGVIIICSKKER